MLSPCQVADPPLVQDISIKIPNKCSWKDQRKKGKHKGKGLKEAKSKGKGIRCRYSGQEAEACGMVIRVTHV